MQFIKTLLTTIFTIFTTLLISRKFGIASTDKDVLEKQYILYNSWYTKISKNKYDETINKKLAQKNINDFIEHINIDSNAYNLITLELKYYLKLFIVNPSKYTIDLQNQFDKDFDYIKYKLGYPTTLKMKNIIKIIMIYYYSNLLWILYQIIYLLSTPMSKLEQNSELFFDGIIVITILIAKSYLLTKHSYEKACKAELMKTINFLIYHFKEKIHTKDKPNNRNNS